MAVENGLKNSTSPARVFFNSIFVSPLPIRRSVRSKSNRSNIDVVVHGSPLEVVVVLELREVSRVGIKKVSRINDL